jgi:hypothetical protein
MTSGSTKHVRTRGGPGTRTCVIQTSGEKTESGLWKGSDRRGVGGIWFGDEARGRNRSPNQDHRHGM